MARIVIPKDFERHAFLLKVDTPDEFSPFLKKDDCITVPPLIRYFQENGLEVYLYGSVAWNVYNFGLGQEYRDIDLLDFPGTSSLSHVQSQLEKAYATRIQNAGQEIPPVPLILEGRTYEVTKPPVRRARYSGCSRSISSPTLPNTEHDYHLFPWMHENEVSRDFSSIDVILSEDKASLKELKV